MRGLIVVLLLAATSGAVAAAGSNIFMTNCAMCHQPGGQGVPGVYPPLKDSVGRYVGVPAGRTYLAHVVSFGMTGTLSSQGQTYNGFMQPWMQLSDADIAEVLNHVLLDFNASLLPKDFVQFTAEEVNRLRAKALTVAEVRSEREALMKLLAPATADDAPRR